MADLEARFARLTTEYEQRRSAALGAVVRWEWYSWEAFDLRPLHYEQDLLRPGRRRTERPPLDRDHHRIGFDAEDRMVAMLEYSGFLGGKVYYETYRDDRAGIVEEAHFYADGRPIHLHEYRFDGGLVRSASMVATGGSSREEYEYTDGRVTRIATYNPEPYTVTNAAYDDAGLSRLEIVWPNHTELRYERPPSGFTVDQACRAVHRELVARVPAAVRDLAIDEPAYCVALAYQPEQPIDVSVHVGLDGQRHAAPTDIWSPADMDEETTVDLSAVADTARLLRQELALADAEDITAPSAPGSERGRDLLCEVAAELNTHDWTHVLPTTDDFVVYAVDVEQVHVDRNLVACLPADRLALLRERRLLPC